MIPGLVPENKPVQRDQKKGIKVFIYGEPKEGKSTAANTFPNPFIISTDGRFGQFTAPAVNIMKGYGNLTPWEYFTEIIDTFLKTYKEQGYETLILDLTEDIWEAVREFVLKQTGKMHESEGRFGNLYQITLQLFEAQIKKIAADEELNVVFVSHGLEKTTKLKDGKEYTEYVPYLNHRAAKVVKGVADLITRLTKVQLEDGTQANVFQVNDDGYAKASNTWFITDLYIVPTYQGIMDAINNSQNK